MPNVYWRDAVSALASVAVMVNVRVRRQPLVLSSALQFNVTGWPQLSLASTNALTLSQVGRLVSAGLQPRSLPCGHVVMVGAVVSWTVIVWVQVAVLVQLSVTVQVRTMVLAQSVPRAVSS